MAISRWRPTRDMFSLQNEINRMFNDFLGWSTGERAADGQTWSPSVNVYDNKDSVVAEVEVPGIDRKDLHISVENNVLTIRGERRWEEKKEERSYHQVERLYGTFQRSFTLPTNVNPERVKATCKDGILTITMPKVEAAKRKEIPVSVE